MWDDERWVQVRGIRESGLNVTSRGTIEWARQLSPFFLGPVTLYGGLTAQNVENAWQFSKVYPEHSDGEGEPIPQYFSWAAAGWRDTRAHRYPMGKGRVPVYSWWDGEQLSYVQARVRIYIPLYRQAVLNSPSWALLQDHATTRRRQDQGVVLTDFDGYVRGNASLHEVAVNPKRKMGHAFVLAMMLAHEHHWDQYYQGLVGQVGSA